AARRGAARVHLDPGHPAQPARLDAPAERGRHPAAGAAPATRAARARAQLTPVRAPPGRDLPLRKGSSARSMPSDQSDKANPTKPIRESRSDEAKPGKQRADTERTMTMQFGLMFFAAPKGAAAQETYRTMLAASRLADEGELAAVWTPERHFDQFGGVFPNPVVTSAALATVTSRVQLRAGSCISPLHNTVRLA